MPRWSRWSEALRRRLPIDDDGSAAVEFIFVGLLLLVPIVYLVIALGAVQHQSLGIESGVRHIARAIATAPDEAEADARAELVRATVAQEYGIDPGSIEVDVDCAGAASTCPSAGSTVVVTLRTTVALPLVPPVLGLAHLARVPLEAVAVQKVSRFWGTS
jgi:Flp pilus assembly protein TadG